MNDEINCLVLLISSLTVSIAIRLKSLFVGDILRIKKLIIAGNR